MSSPSANTSFRGYADYMQTAELDAAFERFIELAYPVSFWLPSAFAIFLHVKKSRKNRHEEASVEETDVPGGVVVEAAATNSSVSLTGATPGEVLPSAAVNPPPIVRPGISEADAQINKTSNIEEAPVAVSGRSHLSLKTLIALCSGLVGTTYAIVKYIEIEPLKNKLGEAKESLTSSETERASLSTRFSTLQAHYAELGKLQKKPVQLLPPDGASLLGGSLVLEWDYLHHDVAEGYILELRELSRPGVNSQVRGVARREIKRQYFDLGRDATGEYLWRVRPGVVSGGTQVAQGPWSSWNAFTMYPDVIHRVKATGKLLAATTPTAYDDFVASDGNGGYHGFEVELLEWVVGSIQRTLGLPEGLRIEYVEIPWNRLFQSVENGEVDLAIRSISYSKHREKEFRNLKFSAGYLVNHQIIIQRGDRGEYPKGLEGATVGVKAKSVNERAARYLVPKFKWKLDSSYTNYGDIYQALQEGKIDVGLVDSVLAAKFLLTRFKQIGPALDQELRDFYAGELGADREKYAIAFHEAEQTNALRDAINQVIESEAGKKKLAELRAKYGLSE